MSLPKSIGAYLDIPPVLDAALIAGGARYTLDRPQDAHRWRSRASHYRTLLRRLRREEYRGMPSLWTTPYDHLVFRIDGSSVLIEVVKSTGRLTTLDDSAVQTAAPPSAEDSLEEEARKFAEGLQ